MNPAQEMATNTTSTTTMAMMMNPMMNPVQGTAMTMNPVSMTNVNMTTTNTPNNLPASNNQTDANGNETTVEVVVPLVPITVLQSLW